MGQFDPTLFQKFKGLTRKGCFIFCSFALSGTHLECVFWEQWHHTHSARPTSMPPGKAGSRTIKQNLSLSP
ncbi:hypothetical protein CKAN_02062300 [Cinnamomum micranthum f. kanehirae]|uniref:Uncharacterized protein n=1 Tax=Cinnamomum micranthum f. kanehirae TaxID=337451 RepID=A0A443PL45_9MAGN|nr:hypothetical protein CKAN_02062300 [Cinnamomum micranthum f. kanehirae]